MITAKAIKNNLSFEKGDILSSKMLRLLYENPNDLINAMFFNYPNGIISGFDILEINNDIILTKGLVKTSFGIFILKEDINIIDEIKKSNIDGVNYLTLKKGTSKCLEKSIIQDSFELSICDKENVSQNDVFLGTVYFDKYNIPTTLTEIEKNFKNIFNLWGCEYSLPNGISIHPYISKLIFKSIDNKKDKDFFDTSLISVISASGTVTREYLNFYCNSKIGKTLNLDNWNTIQNLRLLLDAINKTYLMNYNTSKENNLRSSNTFFPNVNGR